MENPSRIEAFPVGLRVLVVDDDPTWLKVVEKMLRKCSYEVTTCSLARTALDLLREGKEKFDIVISDVNMPDMDGFKLLEHVGLEMDLPVIMMSVDGETSKVMKGVQHGACDYLLKPIRMKELRNIWQHVYRKKILEVREIEGHDIIEGMPLFRNGSEDFDDRLVSALKKRKNTDSKEYSDQDYSDLTSLKKARVVWSVDLHQKFVNAVDQIGYDKVGPKKILDLMNVPGLTRENVASHLQKYRLYLSRLLKQNEAKSYGRNMQSECSPVALQPNFELQSAPIMHQNNGTSKYLPIPITGALHTQNRTPDIHTDQKSTVTVDVKNRKEAPNNGKMNGSSPLGIALSFKGTTPNVDYKSVEPFMPKHQANPCTSHMPLMQFMQYPKHSHKPYSLFEDYSSQVQNQPSIIFSNSEKENEIDKHGVVTPQVSGTKHEFDGPANMKNAEDLPLCPLQNSCCFENIGLNAMELFQYNDSTSLTGFQSNWYDGLESNGEDLYDLVEYPTIDDCLFA